MNTAIISDKLYGQTLRHNFQDTYQGNVDIYAWPDSIGNVYADCLIIDLDLSQRTNDSGYISNNRGDIKERLNLINENITNWLEQGIIVIALISDERRTTGMNIGPMNQPTNYDWLDRLNVVYRVDHQNYRSQIEVVSSTPGLQNYFNHVSGYRFGIRLNERTITRPEILAKHRIDNEPLATAIQEYRDPDGNHRTPPGYLVLLPPPTDFDTDSAGLIRSLETIGAHFVERRNSADFLDESGRVDIEKVLDMGEGDTIEFKEELPGDAHSFAKDLVAFTNKWGGVLIVGIEDETQSVTGVADVDEVKNRVGGVCSSAISPPIDPNMETHVVDGEQVVAVRVSPGSGQLYTTSENVYWRFGPTSESIDGSEVHEYIL